MSAEFSDTHSADGFEVLPVAGDDPEAVFEGGRGDERIGQSRPMFAGDPARPLGHRAGDVELSERCEGLHRQIGRGVAGEQLSTRDDRVAEAMALRLELARTAEVVDEDVGVDEKVSHVASRRAAGPLLRALHRRWR